MRHVKNWFNFWKNWQNFSKIFKNFQNFSKIFKNFKNEKSEKTRKSCLQKMKKVCCNFSLFLKNMFWPTFSLLQNMKITSYDVDLHSKVIGALFNMARNDKTGKTEKLRCQNTLANALLQLLKNTFSCCEHANHVICTPARDPFFIWWSGPFIFFSWWTC